VSLESAKKYGFIASMIQIIIPILTLALLGIFYYQLFYQIISGQSFSTFGTSIIITGVSIVTGIVGIVGFILFLLSMHKLSNIYSEPKIFRNIIYGFLISIIAGIIISILAVIIIVPMSSSVTTLPYPDTAATVVMSVIGVLAVLIGGIVIISIINGFFYWKAFTKLGEKSGVDAFKTTGILYLIGSILQIVGIGSIICWIAWIFAADGYRKLQPQPTTIDTTSYTSASASGISGKIFCSYCGIENDAYDNSNYCKHCGKTLHTNQTSI